MAANRLARFVNAQSIAVIGASEQGLYTAGILGDLVRNGFAGRLYPVNPRRTTVQGLPCYPGLRALPKIPDLVIIVVGRERVLAVIDDAIALGVPAALIITAGFGESDTQGRELEVQLKAQLRESDLAIIGPNCAGFASAVGKIVATRLPAPLTAGGVGFVSASGALMMALHGVFADLRLGISHLISLGNQVDVSLTEALEFLVDDPHTHTIGAFIEGIDDGPRFRTAALAAQRAGKPLVAVKSGRTQAGQLAAATHTAALAGSDRVFQAVCREAGVMLVEDVAELARTLNLSARWQGRLPAGARLALVTQSGGMGSLTADLAVQHGFVLPTLSAALQAELAALPDLLTFADYGNPADVRGAGSVGQAAATTLAPFLRAPDFDAVVLLLAKSAVAAREVETAHALAALAQHAERPFCVVWVGQRVATAATASPSALEILAEAGIPVFEQSGECLRALAHVRDFARAQRNTHLDGQPHIAPAAVRCVTNNDQPPPRWLGYAEVEALFAAAGIPLAPARLVAGEVEALAAADALGYPVAAKLLSPAASHKSDAGLVRLGLANADDLRAVVTALRTQPAAGGGGDILVQKMAAPGVEALIGIDTDAQFGPVIACGVGGVLVELLHEVALRLPPLAQPDAEAMIDESALGRLLAGLRGRPPADRGALVQLLVRVAAWAAHNADQLVSLDINPVIVHREGCSLVDVRVAWRDLPPAAAPPPSLSLPEEHGA